MPETQQMTATDVQNKWKEWEKNPPQSVIDFQEAHQHRVDALVKPLVNRVFEILRNKNLLAEDFDHMIGHNQD